MARRQFGGMTSIFILRKVNFILIFLSDERVLRESLQKSIKGKFAKEY